MRTFRLFLLAVALATTTATISGQSTTETVWRMDDVSAYALSPDRTRIAVTHSNGRLTVYHAATRSVVVRMAGTPFSARGPSGVQWSADGWTLSAAYNDYGRVWDVATGALLYELDDHIVQPFDPDATDLPGVGGVAVSRNREYIATGNVYDELTLIYDGVSGDLIRQLPGRLSYWGGLEFSPDGRWLAIPQTDKTIVVWDMRTGERPLQVPGDMLAFDTASTRIAIGYGFFTGTASLYDLASGAALWTVETPLQIFSVRWSADARTIYANISTGPPGGDARWLQLGIRGYDVATGEQVQLLADSEVLRLPLALEPEETLLYQAWPYNPQRGFVVWVWNRETGEVARRDLPVDSVPLRDYVVTTGAFRDMTLSPDGRLLAARDDEHVVVWRLSTGAPVLTIEPSGGFGGMDFVTSDTLLKLDGDGVLTLLRLNVE